MTAPLRHGHWPRSTWSPFRPLFCQARCPPSRTPAVSASVVSLAAGSDTDSRRFFSNPRSLPHSFTSTSPASSILFGPAVNIQPARGLRLPGVAAADSDSEDDDSSLEGSTRRSKNQLKREARRAVKWGMDLAQFPPPQIKRILRAPRLGLGPLAEDISEALILVKKMGPDVREGKRRQHNYIGRLLREAELPEPELLEGLIQASKDHDNRKFQDLSGKETLASEDEDEEEEEEELGSDEEAQSIMDTTTRWYNGLISKDSSVTKEVYSLYDVEFDRQELRKLVRNVQIVEEEVVPGEEDVENINLAKAKSSLLRFLRHIARQTSLVAYCTILP